MGINHQLFWKQLYQLPRKYWTQLYGIQVPVVSMGFGVVTAAADVVVAALVTDTVAIASSAPTTVPSAGPPGGDAL